MAEGDGEGGEEGEKEVFYLSSMSWWMIDWVFASSKEEEYKIRLGGKRRGVDTILTFLFWGIFLTFFSFVNIVCCSLSWIVTGSQTSCRLFVGPPNDSRKLCEELEYAMADIKS